MKDMDNNEINIGDVVFVATNTKELVRARVESFDNFNVINLKTLNHNRKIRAYSGRVLLDTTEQAKLLSNNEINWIIMALGKEIKIKEQIIHQNEVKLEYKQDADKEELNLIIQMHKDAVNVMEGIISKLRKEEYYDKYEENDI